MTNQFILKSNLDSILIRDSNSIIQFEISSGLYKVNYNNIYIYRCDTVSCTSNSSFEGAIIAAQQSDVIFLVLGLDQNIESEG